MRSDFIIINAQLVDGTGNPPRAGSLLVRNGRIAAVGAFPQPEDVLVIDAMGRVVAPGFIDSHTHDDGYLLAYPDMMPKVSQGITTVVTGNCGISLAPLPDASRVVQPLDLLGPGALFRFPVFGDWLDALRQSAPATHVVPLLGHTTLRVAAMEDVSRAATADERRVMKRLVQQAMDAGAFGVSSGTFYPPASAAPKEEIIEVCEPLKGLGAIYATHLRDESDGIVPAMEEAFEIGRALDARVVLSHHKLAGERNHGRSEETLALVSHTARLQAVCLDCHPYPATSTMLRLDRVRLARRTLITWSKGYPAATGRDFADVQAELGLSDEATLQRLSPAGAIYFLMHAADVRRIFEHPLTMVGSDGLPFDPHPHPRQWGTFTRVLRQLVREEGVLTLEQAIHRMTGLAAAHYGLHRRGTLTPGFYADIVMLDAERVTDLATFESPIQASQGVDAVWADGELVWNGLRTTGARPGKVLRPPHARRGRSESSVAAID